MKAPADPPAGEYSLVPGCEYQADFLADGAAWSLLETLNQTVPWEQHRVKLFGKEFLAPRLSAWYGDEDAVYQYSGTRYQPHPWTDELAGLRDQVQNQTDHDFNSVLLNRYLDGDHGMGWHADDEPELGDLPVIASVSLGARRKLRFRRKDNHSIVGEVWLDHGSLLVMRGRTQADWHHALPKSKRIDSERVNLTFRLIRPRG